MIRDLRGREDVYWVVGELQKVRYGRVLKCRVVLSCFAPEERNQSKVSADHAIYLECLRPAARGPHGGRGAGRLEIQGERVRIRVRPRAFERPLIRTTPDSATASTP